MTSSPQDGRNLPAGEYWYEDVEPDDCFSTGSVVVTNAQIAAFADLSGDHFDVHTNDEFARAQGFPSRIAHGLLVLSLIDGLKNNAPVKLMAVASLGWDWRFRAAVVAGDNISARLRIATKRVSSKGQGLVILALSAAKQGGQIVQEGETTLILRRRTASPSGEGKK